MHQQFNVAEKKSAQSSKSASFYAGMVVVLLICLMLNLFIHNTSQHYTSTPLSLPELEEPQDELEKAAKENDWKIISTQTGDSLASVFKRLGLSQQTLLSVIHDNPHAKKLSGIKPNQQIQFKIHNNVLEEMVFPLNATQVLMVYRKDNKYITRVNSREMTNHHQFLTATVQGSLYGTAKRLNLPYKLVQQMTEIFNWEIDFARDIRSGDQFSILYNAFYIDDKQVDTGDIIAVTYTNRGKVHQAIRHKSATGHEDYYSPQGSSLKKAFTRYPIKFSHISSTFSLSRRHPILHYSRPHKGVDLAAPIGTPIHATGDGRIQVIGRQSDYGNMIKISHNKTWSSVYGHLLKFQKGLAKGNYVKRGQVIGYVGQTGLATGPHCHYEFHVKGQPKNPTTVELPNGAPVPSREIMAFKANAGTLLARLKLYEEGSLAKNKKKKTTRTG